MSGSIFWTVQPETSHRPNASKSNETDAFRSRKLIAAEPQNVSKIFHRATRNGAPIADPRRLPTVPNWDRIVALGVPVSREFLKTMFDFAEWPAFATLEEYAVFCVHRILPIMLVMAHQLRLTN